MSTVWVFLIVGCALGYGLVAANLAHYHRNQSKAWRRKWEDEIRGRNAEDSLIFEWSCRDLMPLWETAYPYVRNMPNHRKYSEWATFCANYPTRESIIAHLEIEGVHFA